MRKFLSAIALVMGMFMLMASALTLTAGTASASHDGENCEATYKRVVDEPAWTETVEHDAVYEYIEHPAVTKTIEGVWANWSPNNTQGPQDYVPIWPSDERGTWHLHNQGVPPGHAGPDGVYQKGGGNSDWFYRQAEKVVVEKEAWTEKRLVKEAWTETIEHEATYKTVVDVPGHCKPPVTTEPPVATPTTPTTEAPQVGTPDSVVRPTPTSAAPPAAAGTPALETDELAYTGNGETVGLIVLGLVLLGVGFYLIRRSRI